MGDNRMTEKQIRFLNNKIDSLLKFLNGKDRKIKPETFDLFCEDNKTKTLIGLDYLYLGTKNKGFNLTLFWGKYESLKTEDDKLDAVDNDTTRYCELIITNKDKSNSTVFWKLKDSMEIEINQRKNK